MFSPYGYGFAPPPPYWGYPPNQMPQVPNDSIEARAIKIAMKLRSKEERKKVKEEEAKEKKKADDKKKVEEGKKRNLLSIEWYILGLLSYPFVGPLYRAATHNLAVFGGQ